MDKENIKNIVVRYGLLVGTALVVLCVVMYFMISYIFENTSNFSSVKTEQSVQKIQVAIDSIKKSQEMYVFWLQNMNNNNTYLLDQINRNNVLIENNNRELLTLKKMYNAKINSVNNYNTSDLDSIFANKYGAFYQYKR